ncbi:3'-5' exonuclease [Ulvibacterium marinum]|uniref:3'-5' exonuclease n=1 Tax=Ulvibacterium marinum TaxID=2419782 RepID=A0A3B0BRH7_9FLAO|nr:3'-5' exonuclease [Ulvibacterium marinum]RKN75925.1 3'-5' exonuclease [Ulvibacterium marinum]
MGLFNKKRRSDLPLFWKEYEALFQKKPTENLQEVRFVVLDTETTGFDYAKDRILSIGALTLQNTKISVADSFSAYLEQEIHSEKTVKIHGIRKEGRNDTIPEEEALQSFLTFLGNAVIIAHHALFDIHMINAALDRLDLPDLKNQYLDTSTLYKKTRLRSNLLQQQENYTLDELADKFNISKKDRHTALGDAYITAIAFLKILAKLREKREVTLKWLLK